MNTHFNHSTMQLTINIDPTNAKALALLNYIKTLDFITFEESQDLTDAQKSAIDKGLEALEQGKSFTHSEVMRETKERYPNLFK